RSYFGVMLVAISTKQHERPKWNGHIEFFLPHASRSCTVVRTMLCRMVSSIELLPFTICPSALSSHHFISQVLEDNAFCLLLAHAVFTLRGGDFAIGGGVYRRLLFAVRAK